jgi:HK97 family phage major capsid protein
MYPIKDKTTERTLEMLALGEMLPEYNGKKLAMETLRRGGSKQDLMRKISEYARSKPLEHMADNLIGFSAGHDAGGYSISRAIRAAMHGNWKEAGLEKDISDLNTTTQSIPNGFFLPMSIGARAFDAGTSTNAGSLIGAARGSLTEDPLRRITPLAQLGATFLTGLTTTLSFPRFLSSTQAAWETETAAPTNLIESTNLVELTPKRCSIQMVVTRQSLLQSNVELDAFITRHLISSCMEILNDAAINGDGTSNSPIGLRNTSGIASVVGGVNGAQLTYAHLSSMEYGPGAANSPETQFGGFIVNPATQKWLRTQPMAAGLPFIWGWGNTDSPLLGRTAAVTNLLPNNLVKGTGGGVCSSLVYSNDWSSLIVGIYGPGLDITVDRVTQAGAGNVVISANMYAGAAIIKPSAFSKMDDALTA